MVTDAAQARRTATPFRYVSQLRYYLGNDAGAQFKPGAAPPPVETRRARKARVTETCFADAASVIAGRANYTSRATNRLAQATFARR